MSTINQGILGAFSGKVGTVIGGIWNGIAYMRGLPISYTNPRTPAQLNQRAKFATAIKFLRPLTSFLRIGYKNQAIRMSAFNAAMSYTLANAITGIYPTFSIDYSKVQVSQGNLPEAFNPSAVTIEAGIVDFLWENNSYETGANATDIPMLVVYCPVLQKAVTSVTGSSRAVGSQTLMLPAIFSGHQAECYISFSDANQEVFSKSQYIGSVPLL